MDILIFIILGAAAIILGAIAIILGAIALSILIPAVVALGALISLPFLWVYEMIERKVRLWRLKRDDAKAEELGLASAYVYRRWKKNAKEPRKAAPPISNPDCACKEKCVHMSEDQDDRLAICKGLPE